MLAEFYPTDSAPHEALGRFARRLSQGGAVYLGGGVGVEKIRAKDGSEKFSITRAGKAEAFDGPLSATIRAFGLAGASKDAASPGGAQKVTDPAVAARLVEIADAERDRRQDIARYGRRLAVKSATPAAYSPGVAQDEAWEVRRIAELKAELTQIEQERRRLLAGGKVEEVEQVRPGTNFTKIPPANVAKLKGIIGHYKGMAHGFTTCVRDQVKHGLTEDHAKRRCAVVTDLGQGTTKWRKGGKGKVSEEAEQLLSEAMTRVSLVEESLGVGMSVALAEGVPGSSPDMLALGEVMANDYALLAMAGHPVAGLLFESFGPPPGAPMPAASHSAGPGTASARARAGGGGSGKYDESKHKRAGKGATGGGRFISTGSAGNTETRTVQHRLGVATDGKFGPKTAAAVREFQRAHGLQVDGVVGRQTLAAMAGKKDAKNVAPGALTSADRRELGKIRSSQTRARAGGSRPTRATKPSQPAEDSPDFRWRKHGDRRRGVVLKGGGKQVVSGPEYDRLKRQGKLSSKTPRLKGD